MDDLINPTIDGKKIIIRKREDYPFGSTNASNAIDNLFNYITKTPFSSKRPVVISLYGFPGVGKNELVRKFAKNLWQHYEIISQRDGKGPFIKFQNFFKEYNFSSLVTKDCISKFMGSSRGIEGGEGDIVSDIKKGARIFFLDEFDKADRSIIKAFGGLFEDGHLIDNSGAFAECHQPSFFFIASNFENEKSEILASEIEDMDAFKDAKDQTKIRDPEVRRKLKELKQEIFKGGLSFIGDRCFHTLLIYQPKSREYKRTLVQKFIQEASEQVCKKIQIAWTEDLEMEYLKYFEDSEISNRELRSEILQDILDCCTEKDSEFNSILSDTSELIDNKLFLLSTIDSDVNNNDTNIKINMSIVDMDTNIKEYCRRIHIQNMPTPQTMKEFIDSEKKQKKKSSSSTSSFHNSSGNKKIYKMKHSYIENNDQESHQTDSKQHFYSFLAGISFVLFLMMILKNIL